MLYQRGTLVFLSFGTEVYNVFVICKSMIVGTRARVGISSTCCYFWKAVTNHSQAASPLGEHSSVVLNQWLGKGRNFEKLSMHLMLTL